MSDEPKRHYATCECGNTENESKDIANGQVKAFRCHACDRTWEVPMATVHGVEGY